MTNWTLDLFLRSTLNELGDSFDMTKREIIDFAEFHGAPQAVIDMLEELDDYESYTSIFDVCPGLDELFEPYELCYY